MDLIPKAVAQKIATQYSSKILDRIAQMLSSGVQSGTIGGVFGFGNAAKADVDAAVTALQAGGWTVVRDDVGFTLTIT